MRELTYCVATTIDGFIAGPHGQIDCFLAEGDHFPALVEEFPETFPAPFRETLGIDATNRRFDAVVMGRATYEPARAAGLMSPYPQLEQYVYSSGLADPGVDGLLVVADDPLEHVRGLKREDGRGIWLCGGGILAAALEPEIDELILKVNPVLLGSGRPVLDGPASPSSWALTDIRHFESGVAITRYRRAGETG